MELTHEATLTNRLGQTVKIRLYQALAYVPVVVHSLPIVDDESTFEIDFQSSNDEGEGIISQSYRPYFYADQASDLFHVFSVNAGKNLMLTVVLGSVEIFRGFPDYESFEKDRFNNQEAISVTFVDGVTLFKTAVYESVLEAISASTNPYNLNDDFDATQRRVPLIDLIATYIYKHFAKSDGSVFMLQRISTWRPGVEHDLGSKFFLNPRAWDTETNIQQVISELAIAFGWRIGFSSTLGKLAIVEQRPAYISGTTYSGKIYAENPSGIRSSFSQNFDLYEVEEAHVIESLDSSELEFKSGSIPPISGATYRKGTADDEQKNNRVSGFDYPYETRKIPFINALTSANDAGCELLTSTGPDVFQIPTLFSHPDITYGTTGWLSTVMASSLAIVSSHKPYFTSWRFAKRSFVKMSLLTPSFFDFMKPMRMKLFGTGNQPIYQPVSGRRNFMDVAVYDLRAIEVRNYEVALDSIADLELWFRPETGINHSSGSVYEWLDQSGNFRDAVQATPANRPQVVANAVNGYPAVYFDNTLEQSLVFPELALYSARITTFIVFQADPSVDQALMSLSSFSNRYVIKSTPSIKGATGEQLGTPAGQNWRVLAIWGIGWDFAFTDLLINQVPVTPFSTVSQTIDLFGQGRIGNGESATGVFNLWLKGAIAEIACYSRTLNSTEFNDIQAHLMQKYGIR